MISYNFENECGTQGYNKIVSRFLITFLMIFYLKTLMLRDYLKVLTNFKIFPKLFKKYQEYFNAIFSILKDFQQFQELFEPIKKIFMNFCMF